MGAACSSFADFLKYIVKEIVIPAGADKAVFMLAPMISFVLPVIVWAVIPWAPGWVISDMNVGILFIFAISSMHVYAIIMGGWASNSKYPFLGGLRSAAQMISYEVSLGFIIVGVLISTGSLNLSRIVEAQDGGWGLFSWYWLPHLPMVVLFFIRALAETNRPPFDLPEAELRAGGGVSGGIFLDAVPALHDRRADERVLHVRADLGPVLRRVAVADPGDPGRGALAVR